MAAVYSIEQIQLDVEVDVRTPTGVASVAVPAVRFSAVFALNEVPKARVTLAPGRAAAGLATSAVHTALFEYLRDKQRVRAYCTITPAGRAGGEWLEAYPAGRFLVFDGYTTGPGFQAAPGAAEFTLGLEHWLADLSYCSLVSPTSHPSNPAAMIFAANHADQLASPDAAASAGYMLASSVAAEYVDDAAVLEDFWAHEVADPEAPGGKRKRGVRGWLDNLAAADAIDSVVSNIGIPNLVGQEQNAAARAALARFEPGSGGYRCGVPLAIDADSSPELDAVAETIVSTIGFDGPLEMANSTAWDKLLEYAQTYLFAVVPLVDSVLVAPVTPGAKTAWVTVGAEEYDRLGWHLETPYVVRGVGVYGGSGFQAGADTTPGGGVDYQTAGIGGYYVDPRRAGGMFKFVAAPPWMASIQTQLYTDATTGGGGAAPVPLAADPGAPAAAGPDAAGLVAGFVPFMNRYAQALYIEEATKGRTGEVSGRLRFDVSPGSVVRVETASERFTEADALGQTFYGLVRAVSVSLDAEAPAAGTTLHLGNVRSAAEAAAGALAVDRHPMWKNPWVGSTLVPVLACPGVSNEDPSV